MWPVNVIIVHDHGTSKLKRCDLLPGFEFNVIFGKVVDCWKYEIGSIIVSWTFLLILDFFFFEEAMKSVMSNYLVGTGYITQLTIL